MNKEKQIDEMAKDICHAPTCEIRKYGGTCYKYCRAYIYAFRAVNAGYRRTSDFAREIFEEIDDEIKNHGITYARRKIDELKKKYTEDGE